MVSILKSSRQDELKLIGGKMKHFKVCLLSSQNWNKHREDLFNYPCLWDLFCGNRNTQSTCSSPCLCLWSHQTSQAKPSGWITNTTGDCQQNSNLVSMKNDAQREGASPQTRESLQQHHFTTHSADQIGGESREKKEQDFRENSRLKP